MPLDEVKTKKIRLAVWDYDFGPTNDYIGEVSIKLDDICTNQKEKKIESYKLINKKRKGRAATIDVTEPPSISSSKSSQHRPQTLEEGKEDETGVKQQTESKSPHHPPSDSQSHSLQHQQQQEQQQPTT